MAWAMVTRNGMDLELAPQVMDVINNVERKLYSFILCEFKGNRLRIGKSVMDSQPDLYHLHFSITFYYNTTINIELEV